MIYRKVEEYVILKKELQKLLFSIVFVGNY